MRFAPRHVHQTVVDFAAAALEAAGWVEDPINFGTSAVTVSSTEPEVGQMQLPTGNAVHITLGDEPPTWEEELGGGVESVNFPVFVDVFGVNETIALSIASDLKDAFRNTVIALMDYTDTSPADSGHRIEFEMVMVETPQATGVDRRRWRVVKTIAHTYFNGE